MMADYVRITDRKIELTDEGVEELMSDYTPTTEEVRDSYASWSAAYPEFDRWLTEVKAQAWEEGWHTGNKDSDGLQPTVNPYREGENNE